MTHKTIDWFELKTKNYLKWRSELYRLTGELLTSSDKVELSKHNRDGYFHHVPNFEQYEQMRMYWERERKVPDEWVSKGYFPGIWTAMFSPHNAFSFSKLPVHIIRFYFKDGFFIYNPENSTHKQLLNSWNGRGRKNPWRNLRNERGESLEERMKSNNYPSHKGFYGDYRFGAVVGYSDYISPVIVLESAIEGVEFPEI